jgi:DNA-binding GntR family transcriptional regulator
MARAVKTVVQVERLRDQVYDLIKGDLKSGAFEPGERLLEAELAEKYKVSRTPVREALFQLSRDGLLGGNERGYVAPVYTAQDAMERLEVKRLIEPAFVEHAILEADAEDLKALAKFHEQAIVAHAANRVRAFNKAYSDFRATFRGMCRNSLLARCVTIVDDQFELVRNRIHESGANRERSILYNGALLNAAQKRDKAGARTATVAFLNFLDVYYTNYAGK